MQNRSPFTNLRPLRLAGRYPVLAAAGLTAFMLTASAPARAQNVEIQYGLSLAGLPIGTAQLAGVFNRDTYKIDVKARMTGLASMLSSGKGAGTSTGITAGAKVVPSSYALVSGAGDKTVSVRMALAGGAVANLQIDPPLDEKVDRVPLLESHKRGVVDPVSALLMPVPATAKLLDPSGCDRTIPVFDGSGRFDVTLSFSATRKVTLPGYSGDVLVCTARYNPIAGHRTGRKSTQFMAENKDMEVWLAPVEGARVLLPLRISVRTMIGTTLIDATKLNGVKAASAPTATSTASAGAAAAGN